MRSILLATGLLCSISPVMGAPLSGPSETDYLRSPAASAFNADDIVFSIDYREISGVGQLDASLRSGLAISESIFGEVSGSESAQDNLQRDGPQNDIRALLGSNLDAPYTPSPKTTPPSGAGSDFIQASEAPSLLLLAGGLSVLGLIGRSRRNTGKDAKKIREKARDDQRMLSW